MGSAKRKTISIYSKNFKTILAINTPTVIPWGQTHARTHARTDGPIFPQYSEISSLGIRSLVFLEKVVKFG